MTALTADEFLARFFAPPNTSWPNAAPQHPAATTLAPFLEALSKRGECPLILPRREPSWPAAVYYVVCWDTAHAGRLRPLLEAAVAHNWSPFDGRVAPLRSEDPIETSVLDLVGPGTTFVLRPPSQTAGPAYLAIKRLVDSLRDMPLRHPNLVRPLGRMLREFDLALATGSADTSAEILYEIETLGGISHENLAYLQLRRLVRLGQDHALLANGSLPTIVYSEPPLLVREAVLGAWGRVNLHLPLTTANLGEAVDAVRAAKPDVAMLVDGSLHNASDPDAITVGALAAIARGDAVLLAGLAATGAIDTELLKDLIPDGEAALAAATPATIESNDFDSNDLDPDVVDTHTRIDSWFGWIDQLGIQEAIAVDLDQTQEWEPAWTVDAELAASIDAVPQIAIDALLSSVAVFLEADDPNHPAMKTAAALLSQYLVAERFGPNDLGAICALLEIFLRGSPPVASYREMLQDIKSYAPQWVAASAAARVLDIADVVASGPNGDPDTRAEFVASLVSPLHHARHRMSPALRRLASLVTNDAGLDIVWTDDELSVEEGSESKSLRVQILLYSLDEGCLLRVGQAAGMQWPLARVNVSADKVGNSALRQHARNADLIVMATRRAAHAATGFITDSADKALIRYADGCGSASMMRAVESGLAELAG
jgi:hypothetical protein